MNDYKELIEELRCFSYVLTNSQKAADAIEQLMHERFIIGETLVDASKLEIEPTDALEKIRAVLRGEI